MVRSFPFQRGVIACVLAFLMVVDVVAAAHPPDDVLRRGTDHRHGDDGLLGRDVVASCLQNHPDPSYEGQVSDAFRAKYIELKLQGFEPGDIVDKLYDIALAGHTGATRSTAAWAVIAYLFERCTIFEDKPWEDAA